MQQSFLFALTCMFRFIFCQKCQLDVLDKSEYIGCFEDYPSRLLPVGGYFGSWTENNKCILKCRDAGSIYAGTEDGGQCWCGDHVDPATVISGCNTPCPADSSQTCGGAWRLSVYRTELSNIPSYTGFGRLFSTIAERRNVNNTKQAISWLSNIESPGMCAAFCLKYEECTGFVLSMATKSCALYHLLYHDLCDYMIQDSYSKIFIR